MSEDQKSQLTDIRRATASIEGKFSEVLGRLSDVEGRLNFLEDAAAEAKAKPAATVTEVESLRRRLDEVEDRSRWGGAPGRDARYPLCSSRWP
ncbi:hypothetical protein AAFF_G00357070 [Aldrovandia affinis]|uniref:Uncharacterized protein n=1 Tax=Aldrovandia affinis TaxID=143900 RepID=A0AAD7T8J1_9TELE|nr:hypothetical protein AAFF_G00357070 [Aldrovandia affinis]